jgi:glucose/arabinose dehydrogenase
VISWSIRPILWAPLAFAILATAIPLDLSAQVAIEPAFPNLTFSRPVDFQHAGDGSDRLFVVEQAGRILSFDNRPDASSTNLFLDIRDRVTSDGNEEGLLGLAFHPAFRDNGQFFVYYTARGSNRCRVTSGRCGVVSRFTTLGSDNQTGDLDSEAIILAVEQPFLNHNGGQIRFGPDGFLYVGLGDGGSGGDPRGNGQNLSTLLGSVLRIDIDGTQDGLNYRIPDDNPFVGTFGRDEIFAYGFRNPWRFSFDSETGDLWLGDVGQNRFEEINLVRNGGNYGWNIVEGRSCYPSGSDCDTTGLEFPIWTYPHGASTGRSVVGGVVYRGDAIPDLAGSYVYSDFVSGNLFELTLQNGGVTNRLLDATGLSISAFGTDEYDEVYFCTFQGRIYSLSGSSDTGVGLERPEPSFRLTPSFPNPSAGQTTFIVDVERAGPGEFVVVDALGRTVLTLFEGQLEAGQHIFRFDTRQLSPGTYFYRFSTPVEASSRKLVVR